MKQLLAALLVFMFFSPEAHPQQKVLAPKDYFGRNLGDNFTPHYKVSEYFKTIAGQSAKAVYQEYGETYEGRSLFVLFISSEQNIQNLEGIRINNLKKAGLLPGEPARDGKAIVWLSYNVHGDESSSTEAAMATAYELLEGNDDHDESWLDNTIVVIDPCVNPDGRDRYVHWYNENRSNMVIVEPYGAEHIQDWPGGRMNHYLFDLNRDWSWLTQKESVHRIKLYNDWLPQIHVDFHEQGYNSPYYFAPAAAPYHELITDWQKDFQVEIGKNHAKYFDKNHWLYFTKERFDLFYPGYGDTYPIFNGAIGMTYEQAGSGMAGLGIRTETGDTLTLADRILHHYTTGLSTIEISSIHAEVLENNFIDFFRNSQIGTNGGYNTFIIKREPGNDKIAKVASLLAQHKIRYGQIWSAKTVRAYDYHQDRIVNMEIKPGDMVIPAQQAKSVLIRVLFEPVSILEDSLTYDITAWSIPYAFGLEAFATNQSFKIETEDSDLMLSEAINNEKVTESYAYAFRRKDIKDMKLLAVLLLKGIRVRTNYTKIISNGVEYPAGTFFILKGDNGNINGNIPDILSVFSEEYGIKIHQISSGFSDSGPDLGSPRLSLINKDLKVGVLYGPGVSPYNVGEVWHMFEHELAYPLQRLNTSYLGLIDMDDLDVIIIPQGYYSDLLDEDMIKKLDKWTSNGGRLILVGSTLRYFTDTESFNLKRFLDDAEKEKLENLKEEDYFRKYEEEERLNIKDKIHGGIYKARLDNSHPIAFGYPDYYFTLKTLEDRYAVLDAGWNVATITGPEDKVSGFSGSNSKAKTYQALIVGMEEKGAGEVIYFVDNPIFRSFWENGKLMFCNAIFMP